MSDVSAFVVFILLLVVIYVEFWFDVFTSTKESKKINVTYYAYPMPILFSSIK